MEPVQVEVNKKGYILQHPGAMAYFKMKKKLQQISTEGFITWDESELLSFCFGKNNGTARVVSRADGSFIEWQKVGIVDDTNLPTLEELSEVWAVILPTFLSKGEQVEPGEDAIYRWVDSNNPDPDQLHFKEPGANKTKR